MANALLVFLGKESGFDGWLRLAGGVLVGAGDELESSPLPVREGGDRLRVAAIVPGDQVTLHWLELPAGLAPAQASAAARLMAGEFSAQPADELHVAVGPEVEGSPLRCVALVSKERMVDWLARCAAAGIDPDMMMPEPLLLVPREGVFLRYDRGDLPLFRGPTEAFSAEPEVAALMTGETPVELLDDGAFEAGLAEALDRRPVDLRQGIFARRRRWAVDWKLARRLALLGMAILIVTLAIQVAAILRYTFATDALEVEANEVAAAALGGEGGPDAQRQLSRRLTQLQGSGVSLSAIASALFGAVSETPNAELTALSFDPGGTLRATVTGDSPATLGALRDRVAARGVAADIGPMGSSGSRQAAELTVRAP